MLFTSKRNQPPSNRTQVNVLDGKSFSRFKDEPKIEHLSFSFRGLETVFAVTIGEINKKLLDLMDIDEIPIIKILRLERKKHNLTSEYKPIKEEAERRIIENDSLESFDDLKVEFIRIPTVGSFSIKIKHKSKDLKLSCESGEIKPINNHGEEASIFKVNHLDEGDWNSYIIMFNL